MSEENAGLFGSSNAGQKGGKARAKSLSAKERSDIARLGAQKRWASSSGGELRQTLREAPLQIGNIELECAVLDDESRVISERAFARGVGAKRGGSHWRRMKANPGGAYLPVFLSAENLKPFISSDLQAALSKPVIYRTQDGQKGYGIRAEHIPEILTVWLKARDADALTKPQQKFALIADTLIRGLATTGIVALIDEATGWQNLRPEDGLARLLEAYIAKDLRKWIPTFPLSFFRALCHAKGIPFREDMRLPQYFGHYINDLVYDRLAPGVRDELCRRNPTTQTGRRKHKHHQWLTEGFGNPSLLFHLGKIEGIATSVAFGDWDAFYKNATKALPKPEDSPLFSEIAKRLKPPSDSQS